MIRFISVLRSAVTATAILLLLSGCARIQSYVSGDPAEKEYQAATKLPPLEIPPEMNRGNVAGSDSLLIPGIDDTQSVVYSAKAGAMAGEQRRQLEAISSLHKDGDGLTTLRVSGGSATAWNEVRGAIAKLGIDVSHQNRDRGIYEVLYPLVGDIERGVIDRLTFWNNDETPMVKVKMVIENLGEPTTLVRAFDGDELDNSATASALLEAIHRQLSPTTASATGTTQAIATAGQFAGEQHASVTAPAASAGRHYRLEQNGAASRIVTTQDFPRTWREVGMAIANESLEVEDRDRSRGLYFVVDQVDSSDQGGLLKRMKFWGSDDPETVTRLVAVQPIDGGGNQILVFDEDEKLDGSAAATALLNRLSKHLH